MYLDNWPAIFCNPTQLEFSDKMVFQKYTHFYGLCSKAWSVEINDPLSCTEKTLQLFLLQLKVYYFFSIPKYFVIVITAQLPNEVQRRVIKIIRLHWSFIVYSNRTNRYENPLGVVCQSMIPVLFIMWMPRKGNVIHVFNIIQKCIYSVASIANYILKIY